MLVLGLSRGNPILKYTIRQSPLEMLIVRHLGTPNAPFSLTSIDVTGRVIQYYTDQCTTPIRKTHATSVQ